MKEAYARSAEAIVLAGGYGSRMGELTREQQKCLLPIDGKPALFHIVDNLIDAFGSVDLKVGVAYRQEQVKEQLDGYINRKLVTVTYVPHKQGAESAGAYRSMIPHVNGSTIVIAPGDIIAESSAYAEAAALFERHEAAFSVTLSPRLDEVDTHGVGRMDTQGMVDEYRFPPPMIDMPEGFLRDMNIYGTNRRFFDIVEQYSASGRAFSVGMNEIVKELPVAANKYTGHWVHIGYPEDLLKTMSTREQPIFQKAA